jgi:quercetin dioxygenase-like cupin family protein
MKKFKLSESGDRGWFVGDFDKAVYRTKEFEVNWQSNSRRQSPSHYHKEITEIQLITRGRMLVNGEIYEAGDIFVFEPGDMCQVEYLEETDTVAIKVPAKPSDKYLL